MHKTHEQRFSSDGSRHAAVVVDRDGEHVYVGYGVDGQVHRFDAERLTLLASVEVDLPGRDEITTFIVGDDGRCLYAGTFGTSALVRIDLDPPLVPVRFPDVTEDSVHAENIAKLVDAGITQGYDDGHLRPEQPVNRQQMASFLTRGLGLEPPDAPIVFADVARGNVHHDSILALAGAGITLGCGGGNFCPDDPVTRAQMASFLVRALDL